MYFIVIIIGKQTIQPKIEIKSNEQEYLEKEKKKKEEKTTKKIVTLSSSDFSPLKMKLGPLGQSLSLENLKGLCVCTLQQIENGKKNLFRNVYANQIA